MEDAATKLASIIEMRQVSHKSRTFLAQVSHISRTSLAQVSHKSRTSLAQVSHNSRTSLAQLSHMSRTSLAPSLARANVDRSHPTLSLYENLRQKGLNSMQRRPPIHLRLFALMLPSLLCDHYNSSHHSMQTAHPPAPLCAHALLTGALPPPRLPDERIVRPLVGGATHNSRIPPYTPPPP